ncbi:DUF3667 domain-containing protein [Portibacter lacus]|nr:DUF3667 domain-containing protein [Portibacter lacus]
MAENIDLICPNCKHENHEGFQFCEQCGQKNKPLKITFYGFIKDFFDVVFNLDNRFWKTISNLFIPGKLTKIFFQGKRKSYYHPLRLYLVAILFLFTIFSLLKLDSSIIQSKTMNLGNAYQKQKLVKNQKEILKNTLDSLKDSNAFYKQNGVTDSISKELFLIYQQDTFYIDNNEKSDSTSVNIFGHYRFSKDELYEEDIDSVIIKKEVTGFTRKLLVKQFIKGARDLGSFNNYLFANLTWLLIALIPIFSLILKLFYVRRKRYYMEHFVFLLHLFTGMIFIAGILMICIIPFGDKSLFGLIMAGVSLIYPYLAFKLYYEQSVLKTLIKYVGIGFFFLFGFLFTFLIFLLVSGAFF